MKPRSAPDIEPARPTDFKSLLKSLGSTRELTPLEQEIEAELARAYQFLKHYPGIYNDPQKRTAFLKTPAAEALRTIGDTLMRLGHEQIHEAVRFRNYPILGIREISAMMEFIGLGLDRSEDGTEFITRYETLAKVRIDPPLTFNKGNGISISTIIGVRALLYKAGIPDQRRLRNLSKGYDLDFLEGNEIPPITLTDMLCIGGSFAEQDRQLHFPPHLDLPLEKVSTEIAQEARHLLQRNLKAHAPSLLESSEIKGIEKSFGGKALAVIWRLAKLHMEAVTRILDLSLNTTDSQSTWGVMADFRRKDMITTDQISAFQFGPNLPFTFQGSASVEALLKNRRLLKALLEKLEKGATTSMPTYIPAPKGLTDTNPRDILYI